MKEIQDLLVDIIKAVFGVDCLPEVTVAPVETGADFSSNVVMKLTRELHKNPREIADAIMNEIEKNNKVKVKAEIAGPGFLNFVLPDAYYAEKIKSLNADFDGQICDNTYVGKTVICEFSDPNPFKVLHVGHLYDSVVGDAISRLFEYEGAKVIRANFGGDVGLHVAKTIYALKKNGNSDLKIEDIAQNYIIGNRAYEEDEEAKAEINALNKEIYSINTNDIHGTELADLYWKGRELSYDYFKEFYKRIGVTFDKYYPESTVANLGLETVRRELAAGIYEMSDGAVVFRGDKYGLHTRVFVNKEGVPTYEAKDVGLIFQKWNDYKFDKSIIITGNEQLDYMKVVLKSIEQYAPELSKKTTHLTHGLVRLPGNVKMSSRLGNGLGAVEVLDLIANELKEEYNSEDFMVVLGAVKYAFLKYKIGGNIIFDPKESVKMTGNSGPYLLYSCVRAKKVLDKVTSNLDGVIDSLLPDEIALVKKVLQYKDVLTEAVAEIAPHKVANYLYELAQEFSRFYEKCPVVGDEREATRGQIVKMYLKTMTHGIHLMGIEIPEEM